jgi:deoxycytidylate deaminase
MSTVGLTLRQGEINEFEDILCLLKKIALHSNINFKHAAALIKKDTLYTSGFNKFIKEVKIRKDNVTQTHYKTIHAEVDALCNYHNKKQIKGMDIIVIRINKKNLLRQSRPCNDCIYKLNKLGIRKVFYSNEKGDIVYEFVEDMPNLHVCSGVRNLKAICC